LNARPRSSNVGFNYFSTKVNVETIEYLKSFNRKERFHLVGQLLGNSEFNLDPNLFRKILDLLELDTPTYYFSAMDYPLRIDTT